MDAPIPQPIDEAQSLLAELMAIAGPVFDDSLKPYARRISVIGYRAKPTDLAVFEMLCKCSARIGEIGDGEGG